MIETCVCWNGNFDNCPHVGAVHTVDIKGFKGEPLEQQQRCEYQLWIGSGYLVLNHITRAEYIQMLKEDTLCTYI